MTTVDHCWSRIGVSGDGTCPELAAVIHCRNCPVYAAAGRSLFAQASPAGYLEQWAAQLTAPAAEEDREALSAVLFRLGEERFALPTAVFMEAVETRPIHRIPHRAGPILLGMANIRGELQLCVSLGALLGVEPAPESVGLPRLAVVGDGSEQWVFPVDEMLGVHRIGRQALSEPGSGGSAAPAGFAAARFDHAGARVALLDAELVFTRLRGAVA